MKTYHTKLRLQGSNYLSLLAIIALLFVSTSFIGCSDDDDDWKKTNIEGRPSKIDYEGDPSTYLYYKNDKLIQVKSEESTAKQFTYENNELTEVYTYQTNPDIMDGTSQASYKREGNKITVKRSGEPGGNYYLVQEIELGTNELPIKITNKGFQYDNDEYPLPEQVLYYTLFTYDDVSNKKLIKKEVYEVDTNKKVGTYTYEYDNNKGMFSNNGLPGWYNISKIDYLESFMYLCTTNNITKIDVDDTR